MTAYETISQVCNMTHPPRRSFRKKRTRPVDTKSEITQLKNNKSKADSEHLPLAFTDLIDIKKISPSSLIAPTALRCLRIHRNLSYEQLGQMIGMDAEHVQSLETGERIAMHNIWIRIASSMNT
jgi:hypothetical protein